MTAIFWKGPGVGGAPYESGDFEAASNWSGGMVPDASSNVSLAPGVYMVTVSTDGFALGSISIGAGVTFSIDKGAGDFITFNLNDDSVNYGNIRINSSTLTLENNSGLVNYGLIFGKESPYTSTVYDGSISNNGVLSASDGSDDSSVAFESTVHNYAGGRIDSRGGGNLLLIGTTTNDGLITAIDGGSILSRNDAYSGTCTNLAGSTLTGGTWIADAAGTIELDGSGIMTIAGGTRVVLDGAGSVLRVFDGTNTIGLETSLGEIASGARLEITGGRGYSTDQSITVDGTLQLGGGHFSTVAPMSVEGVLTGYGVIDAPLVIDGSVLATPDAGDPTGTIRFTSYVTLNGSLGGAGTAVAEAGCFFVIKSDGIGVDHFAVDGGAVVLSAAKAVYSHQFTLLSGQVQLLGDTLVLAGSTELEGGKIQSSDGELVLKGHVTASGGTTLLLTSVASQAAVLVKSGELDVDGAVSGKGGFTIKGGATLEFGAKVATTQAVTFAREGKLELGAAHNFKGVVAGFAEHGVLDLTRFAHAGETLAYKANAAGTGGRLIVTSGHKVVSIHLDGVFHKSGFHIAGDDAGGTRITYADPDQAATTRHPAFADHLDLPAFADHFSVMGMHAPV